ncbi:Low molecular weight protein-tyrosine-phosphatase YfkJ [compost metagenome]
MESNKKIGVLFVCLGNICRSPMAEAVFRDLIKREGLEERFVIDSAGTGDWHIGNPPHQGTRNLLDLKGISYAGLKARQVAVNDFTDFDYIVAMDVKNEKDLLQLAKGQEATIIKLLDLVPEAKIKEVTDPYFTGNFDEVYDLVVRGSQALLEHIQTHSL